MSNNKDFKVKNGLSVGGTIALGAIDASISDTAVDVFVYDTSKDSDGGAWRKRCQHTSWYNETLNTSTRGATKEFPAVAVIVAESTKVTIYDGDDPSMPMWATQASNTVVSSAKRVTAKNGLIGVATTAGYLATFNFVKGGTWELYDASGFDTWSGVLWGSIGSQINTDASIALVNGNVNDVAITVLPNAPIDSATNLPVPTIAVATDGGVSVIKDDGSVVDIKITQNKKGAGKIEFLPDNRIAFTGQQSGADADYWRYLIAPIPTADVSATYWQTYSDAVVQDYAYSKYSTGPFLSHARSGNGDWQSTIEGIANNVVGGRYGLGHLKDDKNTQINGMVAYTASDYATGYMVGDIKLAALSDTDDTDVVGSELVDQTSSGWTLPTGYSHNGSGTLTGASNTGQYSKAYDVNTSFVVGKVYTVTFNVTAKSGSWSFWVNNSSSSVNNWTGTNAISGTGIKSHTFTANSTSGYVVFQCNASGNTITVSDISVRLAEEDRSVNGNGLQIHGTIDKDPVATGADLVAYSGFSTSNYLQQPHQSYMDDVSGNWTATHWGKVDGTSGQAFWEVSQENTDTGGDGAILTFIYLGALKLYMRGNASNQTWEFTTGFAINDNVWHQYTYTKVGNVLTVYQDGVARDTKTLASDGRTYNEADSVLRLGGRSDGDGSALTNGAMALFRFSATVPTAEQIAKIYEDEKPLFQENAKATLYGSSDAVKALAYDDDTELLHVGTSAGRSVFQGLRRVDNTTDAVGSAISASNDLVVEE